MRSSLTALAALALTMGSIDARAQLAPPPPMQTPPPGTSWGAPATPQPVWGAPAPMPSPMMGGQPSTSSTQQQLDAGDASGSFRGFEVAWANLEAGGSYGSFGSGLGSGGPTFGVGLGARFVTWTLGARFRLHPYKDYMLMQIEGEAGFHLPSGPWDPYAKVRAGLARTNDVAGTSIALSGFDAGVALGADYYLSALLSLGAEASGDLILFGAPASTGVLVAGTVHVGMHFDL